MFSNFLLEKTAERVTQNVLYKIAENHAMPGRNRVRDTIIKGSLGGAAVGSIAGLSALGMSQSRKAIEKEVAAKFGKTINSSGNLLHGAGLVGLGLLGGAAVGGLLGAGIGSATRYGELHK